MLCLELCRVFNCEEAMLCINEQLCSTSSFLVVGSSGFLMECLFYMKFFYKSLLSVRELSNLPRLQKISCACTCTDETYIKRMDGPVYDRYSTMDQCMTVTIRLTNVYSKQV